MGKGKVRRKGCQLLSLVVKGFTMGGSLPVLLAVGSRVGKQMPPLTQDGQVGWTPLLS